MSQEFFDPEIFSEFVLEAREHLETIEPRLLELEKEPGNLGILNEIFRPMHSLKGASGFLGLNGMNSLAHKAENILDELRKGNIAVNAEIMDVILEATDALAAMIANLETGGTEGDVDSSPIISHIEALLAIESKAAAGAEGAASGDAPTYQLALAGEEHLGDFLEEAREIVSDLNAALLQMERDPQSASDLVQDIFRFFHNLKGNSAIIGYRELSELTHEAETLLNRMRKGEIGPTRPRIDVLLAVADMVETMICRIDAHKGEVRPTDIRDMVRRIREVSELEDGTQPAQGEIPCLEKDGRDKEASSGAGAEDLTIFSEAVGQQFETIRQALSGLRVEGEGRDLVDSLYRSFSTIQNSCGAMGLEGVREYAGRTAGLVDQARSSGLDFGLMTDLLEQETAILHEMICAELKRSSCPPPELAPVPSMPEPVGQACAAPEDLSELAECALPKERTRAECEKNSKSATTIRVDHEKLDHLMNLIGELIINRNRFSLLARSLQGEEGLQDVAQQLTETTYSMARISDELQDTIMKVRMVPVRTVFSRFPRLVRDLSRKSCKEVELVTEGEETELDKSVVEEIGDPLVHLIRNSVDHGIEEGGLRAETGKPAVGRVWLRAFHKGNSVIIEVEDDGRGVDPARMRAKAVEKGIVSEDEARSMDDQQAVELIFAPGFSTAERITDISGRGVGMDVVRNNIKNLKGSVTVHSVVGKGTKFTLSLPLTLAIIDALMVEVRGDIYAIPLDAVSETTKLSAAKFNEVNERKVVTLRGEVMGIVELSEILGYTTEEDERAIVPIVIVNVNDRRLGLIVDRLLERQEVVIKSLGKYLGDLHGISGATIMGDGSVVLILDPNEIYMRATTKSGLQ
jgi:two-component system, chemotaxis family, sensor kinase CheA